MATRKDIAALRNATESLTDQLNTVGRDNFDPQRQARALFRQIRQLNGKPFIIIIGDSITQRAVLPDAVCELPIINAGIGGSRTSNFVPFAEDLAGFKPALVVVALGINDANGHRITAFKSGFALLLDSLPKVPVILASLTPIDFSGSDGKTMDPEKARSVDSFIRSTAGDRHVPLIDLGKLAPFQTLDGVHLTTDSYALWNAAVLDGIKRALPSCKIMAE